MHAMNGEFLSPPRSEREFRRLLEKLPAGAYMCDADGLITYYNQRAVELWGRAPKLNDPDDRFCGSFRLYLPDGTPLRHDQCWMARALHENQEFNGEEIVIERPTGERMTVLAHANPMHDENGRVSGAVNVLIDITQRRRAEEEVRRAHQTLHALIKSSPLPMVVIDADPPIVRLWNPAAEQLFGWRESEVVGKLIPNVPGEKLKECELCLLRSPPEKRFKGPRPTVASVTVASFT